MKVQYANQQDDSDPMNGTVIAESGKLEELLNWRRNKPPFFIRLSGANGYEIMVGIGGEVGCVQYSRSDGEPPYLVAVPPRPHMTSGDVEFLTGNTLTPVPARNIVSFEELKQIAIYFLQTGERSDVVSWEPV
jgi:hypothetical protein